MNMKKFVICLYFFVVIFTCTGQSLELIDSIEVGNKKIELLLADYIPYFAIERFVFNAHDNRELFSEEYPIIQLSNCNNNLVYTYGYGDVSVPALYDIKSSKKRILEKIIKNGSEQIFYRVTAFISFINSNKIIFSAINPDTSLTDIGIFDMISEEICPIVSIENGIVLDCFENEIIFYTVRDNKFNFFSVGAISHEMRDLKISGMRRLLALGEKRYIGLGNTRESGLYFIDQDNKQRLVGQDTLGLIRAETGDELIALVGDDEIEQIQIYRYCSCFSPRPTQKLIGGG